MSRSVADATRFTATSPHAFTKPTTSRLAAARAATSRSPHPQSQRKAPTPNTNHTSGPIETPAQKVARLRAAHAAKRAAEISAWDKIVVRGRSIADSAHRITVMGLVGFTVIAAGVTVFSLGDMILYNRRKKREWYADQHEKWQQALALAVAAEANGTANDDQILLLNRERAAAQAEQERQNRKGVWKSIKGVFSSEHLKKEEKPFGLENLGEKPSVDDGSAPVSPSEAPHVKDSTQKSTSTSSILDAIQEKRREGERLLEDKGSEPGPLDQMAEQATKATTSSTSTKGWSSWFGR